MRFAIVLSLVALPCFASEDIADQYPASVLYSKPVEVIPGVFSAIGATAPPTYENAGHNNNLSFIVTDEGVVVVGVQPGSPADDAGIRQGDIIVEVNRQAVKSVDDVKENIGKTNDDERLLLLVQRQNGKFYVPLEQQG